MPQLSLGTIEVLGLPAAVEAADVALKTADVKLIGYETTDGMGMVAVKIEGQVSAVQAAVAAASAAAARVSKVFATSIIARPSDQVESVVYTAETVGYAKPKPAAAPEPVAAPRAEPVAAPVAEPEPVAETVIEPEPVAETVIEPEPVAETTPVVELPAPPKPQTTRRAPAPKSRPTKK
jgi:microcompartment protein CcmL/EutN